MIRDRPKIKKNIFGELLSRFWPGMKNSEQQTSDNIFLFELLIRDHTVLSREYIHEQGRRIRENEMRSSTARIQTELIKTNSSEFTNVRITPEFSCTRRQSILYQI